MIGHTFYDEILGPTVRFTDTQEVEVWAIDDQNRFLAVNHNDVFGCTRDRPCRRMDIQSMELGVAPERTVWLRTEPVGVDGQTDTTGVSERGCLLWLTGLQQCQAQKRAKETSE